MAKKSIADASAELYKLLEPFDQDERARIVRGTLTLLGDASLAGEVGQQRQGGQQQNRQQGQQQDGQQAGKLQLDQAKKFFNEKSPKGLSEALATAARYFETHGGAGPMQKDDFKAVLDAARRDFSSHNFARDMDNATRTGYFNAGGGKKGYTLSHYGEDYIDALPDRAAAKAVQRPKRSGWAKAKRKKATKSST